MSPPRNGWAQVVAGEVTANQVLAFLTARVLPAYQDAGWTLRTVLTDNGKEFKTAFDQGCQRLGLTHRRTKPRHAWTNGAVERFQGTILHEHWRVAFRREYLGACGPCNDRWRASCASIIGSDRITAIGSTVAPRRAPSSAPPPRERARRPHPPRPARTASAWEELSTPMRDRTS